MALRRCRHHKVAALCPTLRLMKPTQALTPEQELEIFKNEPEPQVCMLLAQKVRELRNATGESQTAFAQRAGISVRTYKRFELEGQASLENFIQILRALDRTRYLPSLFVQSGRMIRPPSINERIEKLLTRDPRELLQRAHDLNTPIGKTGPTEYQNSQIARDPYGVDKRPVTPQSNLGPRCFSCGTNDMWNGIRCLRCGAIDDD